MWFWFALYEVIETSTTTTTLDDDDEQDALATETFVERTLVMMTYWISIGLWR